MSAPSSTDPTSRMKIVRVPCERIGMLPRPLTSPTTELSGTIGYRSPIWQTTPGSSCRLSRSPVPGQANVPATESWREAAQMLVHFLSPRDQKTSSVEQNLDDQPSWDSRESAGPDDKGHIARRSPRD